MTSMIQCPVEWVTEQGARELFGLGRTRLAELRASGEIRWRKLPKRDGSGAGGKARVLMNAESIRQWIERQEGGPQE